MTETDTETCPRDLIEVELPLVKLPTWQVEPVIGRFKRVLTAKAVMTEEATVEVKRITQECENVRIILIGTVKPKQTSLFADQEEDGWTDADLGDDEDPTAAGHHAEDPGDRPTWVYRITNRLLDKTVSRQTAEENPETLLHMACATLPEEEKESWTLANIEIRRRMRGKDHSKDEFVLWYEPEPVQEEENPEEGLMSREEALVGAAA